MFSNSMRNTIRDKYDHSNNNSTSAPYEAPITHTIIEMVRVRTIVHSQETKTQDFSHD